MVVAEVHIVNAVVLDQQEGLCADCFRPCELPFKPLPVLCEVPADFRQAHLALDKDIVFQGLVAKHGGVVAGVELPYLARDAVLFKPFLTMRILLSGIADDSEFC